MASGTVQASDVINELPALRRYALTLTRHRLDAEDLLHDALVRAMERRATFAPGADLRPWLLSIVHNLFVDRKRSGASAARRDRDYGSQSVEVLPPSQIDTVRLAQVRRALERLPQEQREALQLVTIDGLGYEEAAAVMGVPAGTVMSRIARGRAALRRWESGADVAERL